MSDAVLVVSNDPNIRSALASFVAGAGAAVEIADLSAHGMERLQYGSLPRAVIVDVNLTEVQAPAVLRALAQKYPELPIVMVGNEMTDAESAVLIGLGASAVLTQRDIPTEMPRILEAMAQLPPTATSFRASQRVPARLPIELQLGPGQPLEVHETRDISLSGLFIRMPMPLSAKTQLRMRLDLGNDSFIDVDGEVTRAIEAGDDSGVAVTFLGCAQLERERLATLLARLVARQQSKTKQGDSAPSLDLSQLFSDAQALAANPLVNDADTELARGQRMLHVGTFALAQLHLAKAMQEDPENEAIEFLYLLAGAREAVRLHQNDRATEGYSQILALDPDCEEARLALKKLVETRVRKKGVLKKMASKS